MPRRPAAWLYVSESERPNPCAHCNGLFLSCFQTAGGDAEAPCLSTSEGYRFSQFKHPIGSDAEDTSPTVPHVLQREDVNWSVPLEIYGSRISPCRAVLRPNVHSSPEGRH